LDPLKSPELVLARVHWDEMSLQVSDASPEEACGLIAGNGNTAKRIYPIPNELHSPVRFRLEAQMQLKAFMDIEKHGFELLAIYHSHPSGPGFPSETDLREFAYPGVFYLIWYPGEFSWKCRCFVINEPDLTEINVRIVP